MLVKWRRVGISFDCGTTLNLFCIERMGSLPGEVYQQRYVDGLLVSLILDVDFFMPYWILPDKHVLTKPPKNTMRPVADAEQMENTHIKTVNSETRRRRSQ